MSVARESVSRDLLDRVFVRKVSSHSTVEWSAIWRIFEIDSHDLVVMLSLRILVIKMS